MKLDQYIALHGVWGRVNAQAPSPIPFVVQQTSEVLDLDLGFKWGEREVIEKVVNLNPDSVAQMIVSTFYQKWIRQIEATTGVDLTAKDVHTIEDVLSESTNGTKNANAENKVSAYNDDSLVTESGNTNTEENEGERNVSKTLTEKRSDLSVIFSNLSLFQKMDIIQTANRDIVNTITHRIY